MRGEECDGDALRARTPEDFKQNIEAITLELIRVLHNAAIQLYAFARVEVVHSTTTDGTYIRLGYDGYLLGNSFFANIRTIPESLKTAIKELLHWNVTRFSYFCELNRLQDTLLTWLMENPESEFTNNLCDFEAGKFPPAPPPVSVDFDPMQPNPEPRTPIVRLPEPRPRERDSTTTAETVSLRQEVKDLLSRQR